MPVVFTLHYIKLKWLSRSMYAAVCIGLSRCLFWARLDSSLWPTTRAPIAVVPDRFERDRSARLTSFGKHWLKVVTRRCMVAYSNRTYGRLNRAVPTYSDRQACDDWHLTPSPIVAVFIMRRSQRSNRRAPVVYCYRHRQLFHLSCLFQFTVFL